MGAGQPGLLTDALRSDHDVRKREVDIRKSAEKLGVEVARPGVTLPTVAGRDDLVHTVGGQRGDQPIQIPIVFGDRVRFPELADSLALGRIKGSFEELSRIDASDQPQSLGGSYCVGLAV